MIDEREKIATAYHEAGHAVVQYLEKDADPIHKVTIIPRAGNYGGATMGRLPEKGPHVPFQKMVLCVHEGLFRRTYRRGDVHRRRANTGRREISVRRRAGAARMIRDWGMSSDRIGFVFYGEDDSKMNYFDFGGGGRDYF